MVLLVYSMAFIDTMNGGTQTFFDQVVTASIVNLTIIYSLVLGIAFMIYERVVYKNNPKEWREHFQYNEKRHIRPMTLEELNFCLREGLRKGLTHSELSFDKLEYDEVLHKAEKSKSEGKKKIITEVNKKKHDNSYMGNPLERRYIFLIAITIFSTSLCGLYLPIMYTLKRVNSNIFSPDEYKDTNNLR